ncbi:hypothetical protein KM043_016530 [Ampulex compressa]|nr:hypothetical protein KM043_016530 [Ampulex compressa]
MAWKKRKIARKMTRRRGRRPKPMKIAALIVSAIQDLRESKGSTPRKIVGYISYASNMPEGRVKRQVKAALKRGVEYGILRRYRGHYFLPTGDELDRANRIAVRFARLPTPGLLSTKSKSISKRRPTPARDRKKPTGLRRKPRKYGRVKGPDSPGPSLSTKEPTIHDLSTVP